MDITIPEKPEMSTRAKIDFVIEVAFGSLMAEAKRMGLPVLPVMGLMYLPDEAVTQQWKEAGCAVLANVGVADEDQAQE